MKSINPPLFACLACLFLISIGCRTQQKTAKTPVKKKNSSFLLQKLKDNELDYQWLSARAATNTTIGDKKLQITMKIRIRKDSAIWMSISPALGIEMARVLITQDSIKFLNRLEKNHIASTINYLDKLAPLGINYKMLQSLFTGNNIVVQEEPESEKPDKYKVEIDDGKYLLSTLKMKKYRKTVQGRKTGDVTVNRIWLQPKTFKITRSEYRNFKSNKNIVAAYDQFEEVEGKLIAHLVEVVMQADQLVTVTLNYSRVMLNKPLKMPYRIPSKYETLNK